MQLHEVLRVTKLRQEVKSQLPELVGSNDELALKGAELQVFTVKEPWRRMVMTAAKQCDADVLPGLQA